MWGNHKYLIFQAPVLIFLYIPALIEIAAVGSGKIRSVIDNGRALAFEKLIEFQVCLCIDRISQKLGEESAEQGFSVNLDILFFKVSFFTFFSISSFPAASAIISFASMGIQSPSLRLHL